MSQKNGSRKKIEFIQFGLMSPEEIEKYAVCKIENTNIKNPEFGNVYDPRMGPMDNINPCQTCGKHNIECVGHFGHIDLQIKVAHPKFSSYILYILKSVCFYCSKLVIPKEYLELQSMFDYDDLERLKLIVSELKRYHIDCCIHCGKAVYTFSYAYPSFYRIFETKNEKEKIEVKVDKIYDIFRKISDEDVHTMGFNNYLSDNSKYKNKNYFLTSSMKHRHQFRPEWMILTKLLVLPICDRPCINSGAGDKQDDDLTDKYVSISKANNKLEQLNNPEKKLNDRKRNLKYTEHERKKIERELKDHIKSLFDNSDEKSVLSNGRPHKCFKKRIDGKHGRMRGCQKKRVDYTARTVIDAGPEIRFGDLGVSPKLAETLTKQRVINRINFELYKKLLKNGKINYIIRNGARLNLRKYNNCTLRYGDVVGRQLMNGDTVLLNRQPSLRVESMNAHKIVISPLAHEKVLRLNLSQCNGYNADFDGDFLMKIIL